MLSRAGAIAGQVLDADGGTGEHASRWLAGPVEPATIDITSAPGRPPGGQVDGRQPAAF